MRHAPLLLVFAAVFGLPAVAAADAMCIDTTGTMCLDVIRAGRPDGVVEDIFRTSDGRFAPQLTFARYVRGVNGCIGNTTDRTILTGYTCHTAMAGEDVGPYADSLDWAWSQVIRTHDDGTGVADGEPGFYIPWRGRIYDLGGEANRVVLLPVTDHEPLPCEAFEYSVWLSNDPDATELAAPDAPDSSRWNPARLIRAFTQGWTRNPNAIGAAEATRPDLDAWLHDTTGGEAVADALATVWALPCGLTFRYVAIQAGNYGNPGPECVFDSSDDELDAAAGLNEDDTVICVDADEDGHRDAACGGDDCDDADAAVHPGAFEPCDAIRDLDCQPAIACPAGTVCDGTSGLCVVRCFEGGCAAGFTCVADTCVETACAMLATPCARGTVCRAGACVAPCDGAVCPAGEVCREGACIDPCLGVRCPTNQVCIAGRPGATTLCGPACTCTDLGTASLCEVGSACDARAGSDTFGLCVEPGCESLACADSERCEAGACVDACAGVSCPLDQRCTAGECVFDPCARITCPAGQSCREGACVDACAGVPCAPPTVCRAGACVDPCAGVPCFAGQTCMNGICVGADSGVADAGSTADTGAQDTGLAPRDMGRSRVGVAEPGCGCRAVGASPSTSRMHWLSLTALVGFLACAARLRRRR